MPPDEARTEDVGAWLARARSDLGAGAHDLTADPPFAADAAFHAQQGVEKAIKGFLAWHDVPFRRTHDLTELGHQCAEIDGSLEATLARAARLTEYAWQFRYPAVAPNPTRLEAEEALSIAEEVYVAILNRLPGDTHP